MNKLRRAKTFFAFFLVVSVLLAGFVGFKIGENHVVSQAANSSFANINSGNADKVDFSLFWQAYSELKANYVGDIDAKKLLYGAIAGAYASVGDPYTTFLSPDVSKDFENELSGSLEGVGIKVGVFENYPAVIACLEGSPAQKAGLKPKDKITKVDGADVMGMTLDEVISKIRGQEGTEVKLTILRAGAEKDYTLKRAKIVVNSVETKKIGAVAVIIINEFGVNTTEEFKRAITSYKSQGIDKFIIDLRSNPGGLLDSAVEIGGEVFNSGTVVVKEKSKISEKDYKADGPGTIKNDKLIILVNDGSASAAEILAGAVKDNGRGKVIGMKTFGKGTVQILSPLPGGSSAKITTAKWLTPKGTDIDKNGVVPDIEVSEPDNQAFQDVDPILQKGLEEINK